jgi:head-tail adaptor
MGLEPGDLDRRIVVQTATRSRDETTGEEILTWGEDDTVWAQWLPGSAREIWQARQIDATIEGGYKVYDLPTRPTPDGSRIVGHDDRLYDVKGVTELGRGEGLLIAVAARAEEPA